MKEIMVLILALAVLLSCSQAPKPKPSASKPEQPARASFELQSAAFAADQPIPDAYTGVGENKSPGLIWTNPPPGVKSFVLICEDPDAPMGTFTHWLLYNLPASASALPEALPKQESLPDGTRQLRNDGARVGYFGPMPPPGKVHHYIFTLYALDRVLGRVADKQELKAAMTGHILAQTTLTGTYRR